MHGGTNAGPPRGNTNRLVHGRDSAAALTERAMRKAGRMGVRAMTEILAGVNSTGYKLANDGNGYAVDPGLSRPSEHPAHGSLHRVVAEPVQGFLAVIGVDANAKGGHG
jgi:hypothetical protein